MESKVKVQGDGHGNLANLIAPAPLKESTMSDVHRVRKKRCHFIFACNSAKC